MNWPVKIINVFKFPTDKRKFIVSTEIKGNTLPSLGDYLKLSATEIWKITGVVSAGIDNNNKNVITERQESGLWDLVIEPVFSKRKAPSLGKAYVSSNFPLSSNGKWLLEKRLSVSRYFTNLWLRFFRSQI